MMTTTSRLSMLDRDVDQRLGDLLAAVERLLEVLEDLLLAQDGLGVDRGIVEQLAEGVAEELVALPLELVHLLAEVDHLVVAVAAQLADRLGEDPGAGLEPL